MLVASLSLLAFAIVGQLDEHENLIAHITLSTVFEFDTDVVFQSENPRTVESVSLVIPKIQSLGLL